MLSDILSTRFVVHYSRVRGVRCTLGNAGIEYDVHDPKTCPYVGFSVFAYDVGRVADVLKKVGHKVAAVDGDINGDMDDVPRDRITSYGEVPGTNYGRLYFNKSIRHRKPENEPLFIEDGDVFNARLKCLRRDA